MAWLVFRKSTHQIYAQKKPLAICIYMYIRKHIYTKRKPRTAGSPGLPCRRTCPAPAASPTAPVHIVCMHVCSFSPRSSLSVVNVHVHAPFRVCIFIQVTHIAIHTDTHMCVCPPHAYSFIRSSTMYVQTHPSCPVTHLHASHHEPRRQRRRHVGSHGDGEAIGGDAPQELSQERGLDFQEAGEGEGGGGHAGEHLFVVCRVGLVRACVRMHIDGWVCCSFMSIGVGQACICT